MKWALNMARQPIRSYAISHSHPNETRWMRVALYTYYPKIILMQANRPSHIRIFIVFRLLLMLESCHLYVCVCEWASCSRFGKVVTAATERVPGTRIDDTILRLKMSWPSLPWQMQFILLSNSSFLFDSVGGHADRIHLFIIIICITKYISFKLI